MKNSVKKIILLLLILIGFVLLVSSCGNREAGIDANQTFKSAWINLGGEWVQVDVKAWRDFQNGDEIQIKTAEGRVYLTHYANVVLIDK